MLPLKRALLVADVFYPWWTLVNKCSGYGCGGDGGGCQIWADKVSRWENLLLSKLFFFNWWLPQSLKISLKFKPALLQLNWLTTEGYRRVWSQTHRKLWELTSTLVLRGMLETLSLIRCVKLLQPFSKYARDQQVSAYNHSFLTICQSHGCKQILFSLLHAKKIDVAVWNYSVSVLGRNKRNRVKYSTLYESALPGSFINKDKLNKSYVFFVC